VREPAVFLGARVPPRASTFALLDLRDTAARKSGDPAGRRSPASPCL